MNIITEIIELVENVRITRYIQTIIHNDLHSCTISGDNIIEIVSFDSRINTLWISHAPVSQLPTLPPNIIKLFVYKTNVVTLPTLPESLEYLVCTCNNIESLPILPNNLLHLWCRENKLVKLPKLPNTLTQLICYDNKLTKLIENCGRCENCLHKKSISTCINNILPQNLIILNCSNNCLTSIPLFSSKLESLICEYNKITELPAFPIFPLNHLITINCSHNNIYTIPYYNDIQYDSDKNIYMNTIDMCMYNNNPFSNNIQCVEYITYTKLYNTYMTEQKNKSRKRTAIFKEELMIKCWDLVNNKYIVYEEE